MEPREQVAEGARSIRLVLVDDSPLVLRMLQQGLSRFQDIRVVGTAGDGVEALEVIARTRPDILCTDLHMPRMDGLELTRRIMQTRPLPIIVVSVSVFPDDTENVFNLMAAGAIDVFEKPRGGLDAEHLETYDALARRIRVVAGVSVFRRKPQEGGAGLREVPPRRPAKEVGVVAVGASTGGPLALRDVLAALPADFPVPLVCVQHIGRGFLAGLVKWLDGATPLKVEIAREDVQPMPGKAYFAPEGSHLVFGDEGRLDFDDGDPRGGGHKPSVDVLFESTARGFGSRACGVLLTGMGFDGAQGLMAILQAGGLAIAQDEASSVVWGMPGAAVAVGAVKQTVALEAIPRMLLAAVAPHPDPGRGGRPGTKAR